jgi:hypothetical protein
VDGNMGVGAEVIYSENKQNVKAHECQFTDFLSSFQCKKKSNNIEERDKTYDHITLFNFAT